jgi:hypothetical protein
MLGGKRGDSVTLDQGGREDLMRKRIAILFTALAMLVAGAAPAGAIQFGNVDGDAHPYVGMVLFFDAREGAWFRCSGSMIDTTVFVTAGHCVFAVGLDGELTTTLRDGNDAWVNLETEIELVAEGFPPFDPENPYQPRADFLNADSNWTRAEKVSAHPAYADFAGFPNTSDIGVVILSEELTVSRYASLPWWWGRWRCGTGPPSSATGSRGCFPTSSPT